MLVFYSLDEAHVAHLAPDQGATVGRGPQCDISFDEPSLSRRHAEFTFDDSGLSIRDLGSRNGIKVGGVLHAELKLAEGQSASLGDVVVTRRRTGNSIQHAGLDSYDRMLTRVDEELLRASTFRRELSLIAIQVGTGSPGEPLQHVSEWAPAVQTQLRALDRLSMHSPTTALLLLPESDPDRGRQCAEAIAASLPGATCAIANYPETAHSAHELVSNAVELLQSASIAGVWAPIVAESSNARAVGRAIIVSPKMHALYAMVRRVGPIDAPVLVLGETGVGKECVVQALHAAGERAAGPLRTINCAALPDTLLESLLFGHEKGAFTGAQRASAGLFEQASGGTVFLDEVGELSRAAQASLLRVLETKQITRLGATREVPVDVRVVAATHRPLQEMIAAGEFRADLYHRLNTVILEVPPLRERPEEVEALAEHFLAMARQAWKLPQCGLSLEALECLRAHRWPGNVRELRNAVERAAAICAGPLIRTAELPVGVRVSSRPAEVSVPPTEHPAPMEPADPSPPSSGEGATREGATREDAATTAQGFKVQVKVLETQLIHDALVKSHGNRARAAKLLDMPRRTLTEKIRAYGLADVGLPKR